MTVKVQKWGNSLGVRLSKAVAKAANLDQGSRVDVVVEDGMVVLKPVDVPSLEELLKQVKKGGRPSLQEWGEPVGNEVW